jgi:hypothetical protein
MPAGAQPVRGRGKLSFFKSLAVGAGG